MTACSVICNNIYKSYGPVQAVRGVSLTANAGDTLVLLGPSGCGKTTLLRVIAGFEQPQAGSVEIGGQLVTGPGVSMPPEQRQVGMIFQNYALFPHLTVAANVGYGIKSHKDRESRVREVLELVGLGELGQRMPHELSGGQQQRVALARALAPRPNVLLFDEPFSNLDADRRATMRMQVREILKNAQTTAIFVTHDQEEAMFMGDTIAVMRDGQVEQVGTPHDIFHAPATRFVAEFMGDSFFLPGVITSNGVETEIGTAPVTTPFTTGTRVDVLIRSDDLQLATADAPGAFIQTRQFRGESYLYEVQLASGRVVRASTSHTVDFPPQTPVWVTLNPGHPLTCFATQ